MITVRHVPDHIRDLINHQPGDSVIQTIQESGLDSTPVAHVNTHSLSEAHGATTESGWDAMRVWIENNPTRNTERGDILVRNGVYYIILGNGVYTLVSRKHR